MRNQFQNLDVTLSLFVVPADLPLPGALCAIADKFGFYTLTSFEVESIPWACRSRLFALGARSPRNGRWKVLVTADFAPRPLAWKGGEVDWGQTVDNGRLSDIPTLWAYFYEFARQSGVTLSGNEMLFVTPTSNVVLDLLTQWAPEIVSGIEEVVSGLVRSMKPTLPVTSELDPTGWCRDARTYLAQYHGRTVVQKVFRPGRERFVENNRVASQRLDDIEEAPKVIDWGPNWVAIEFFDNAVSLKEFVKKFELLPMPVVRSLSSLVHAIHKRGLGHLDFNPRNVLIDSRGALRVIDFDQIYQYKNDRPPIVENVMLAGYDEIMGLDGPAHRWSYDEAWKKITGLPLDVFLEPRGYRVSAWRFRSRLLTARRRLKHALWRRGKKTRVNC